MSEERDDNAPVTAAFLMEMFAAFETRLNQRLAALESRVDGRLVALRAEMIERIEDTETRLLKEFRKWAVRIESAGRVNDARTFGIDQRVAVLEERVNELEEPRRH